MGLRDEVFVSSCATYQEGRKEGEESEVIGDEEEWGRYVRAPCCT